MCVARVDVPVRIKNMYVVAHGLSCHVQEPTEEATPEEDELEAVVKAGKMGKRSNLGAKFDRYLHNNPDENEKYQKLTSRSEKEAMRLRWANKQLNSLKKSRREVMSFQQVDVNSGIY